MNRLILCLKRNDQYNPSDKNWGAKHLMPAFWHDEVTMGEFNMTPRLQTEAFTHLSIDRSLLSWCKDIVKQEEFDLDGVLYKRKRKFVFIEDELAIALKNVDLPGLWKGPGHMGLLDATGLPLGQNVRPSLEIDWSKISPLTDLKLVTAGDYLIGSGGGDDYANYVAADVDTGTQTGNIRFTLNSNVTDTALAHWSGSNGGFKITLDSALSHGGDATAGYITNCNHASHHIILNQTSTGTQEVKDLRFERLTNASSSSIYLFLASAVTSPGSFHDCFLDGGGLTGSNLFIYGKVGGHTCYNVISHSASRGFLGALYVGGSLTVENMGVRNCSGAGIDTTNNAGTYRNCWSFANTGNDYDTVTGGPTGNNLSSEDNSAFGTNNHISLTEANELLSTDDTNASFGHLKAGGTNETGGSAPTVATVDMQGTAYASSYPVGPFMLDPVAGGGSKLIDGFLIDNYLVNGSLVS